MAVTSINNLTGSIIIYDDRIEIANPGQTGFSVTNIKYAKRWYEFYNQEDVIRQQVVDEFEMPTDFGLIPWGHHIEIFTRSKSVNEAIFYIEETIQNSWSRAELGVEIDNNLYEKQGHAITNFDEKLPAPYSGLAKAILKSPYDFRFIDKKPAIIRPFLSHPTEISVGCVLISRNPTVACLDKSPKGVYLCNPEPKA